MMMLQTSVRSQRLASALFRTGIPRFINRKYFPEDASRIGSMLQRSSIDCSHVGSTFRRSPERVAHAGSSHWRSPFDRFPHFPGEKHSPKLASCVGSTFRRRPVGCFQRWKRSPVFSGEAFRRGKHPSAFSSGLFPRKETPSGVLRSAWPTQETVTGVLRSGGSDVGSGRWRMLLTMENAQEPYSGRVMTIIYEISDVLPKSPTVSARLSQPRRARKCLKCWNLPTFSSKSHPAAAETATLRPLGNTSLKSCPAQKERRHPACASRLFAERFSLPVPLQPLRKFPFQLNFLGKVGHLLRLRANLDGARKISRFRIGGGQGV